MEFIIRSQIEERDKTCRVWACLTRPERLYILYNHYDNYIRFCNELDPAHIHGRGARPDLVNDIKNVVLMSRYFHRLFDDYRDLLTAESIKKEQRIEWCNRFMRHSEIWSQEEDYFNFMEKK